MTEAYRYDVSGALDADDAPEVRAPTVAAAPAAPTRLAGVLADLAPLDDQDAITLRVPARPAYTVRYGTDLDYEQYAFLTLGARDPSMPGGVNEMALSCVLLATLCRAVQVDGEDITENGEPVTFDSRHLQQMLQVKKPADAVRKLYGKDGHITQTARRLLAACGYAGDAGLDVVPTKSG